MQQFTRMISGCILIIPGLNDDPKEIDSLIRWVIENLGPDTPMHFTRYHPEYQMTKPQATPIRQLEAIYELAKEHGLLYPYLGNIPDSPYQNTYCPSCGAVLIQRHGYRIDISGLKQDRCIICGHRTPIQLI